MLRRFLPFILTLLFATNLNAAQKVGVVMGGGGAKGLYHIGVLRALEESGVPIDYVGGTSIGAIVAGLYASGYTIEEMEKLALSGELEKWVSGKISQNYVPYFRKGSTLRQNNSAISFRMNPNGNQEKISRMPQSIISTSQIDLAISGLFTPASIACEENFNKLMVPFFCVASDVTTNEMLEITDGDLGRAVRASMAVPIAFSPIVTDDGHLLYDGGIHDNFPWQSLIDIYNPDMIIGSVCNVDYWTNTQNLSIMDQLFQLVMNETDYTLPEGGVTISRDAPTGMFDFGNAAEVMRLGYEDTMLKIDDIVAKFDKSELRTAEYYKARREEFRAKRPALNFNTYNVTGLDEDQRRYATEYMETTKREQRKGADKQQTMNFVELHKRLLTMLSAGDFVTSYPSVAPSDEEGLYTLDIKMEHRPALKLSLEGNLSSTPYSHVYLSGEYTVIRRVANTLFAEFNLGALSSMGRFGYRADLYTSAPIFIDAYYNFASSNFSHGDFGNISPVDNTESFKSVDHYLSLGIGAPLSRRSHILLRLNAGIETFKYDDGVATDNYLFDKTQYRYLASKLEIERSTLDNIHYPTRGSHLALSAIGVTGHEVSYGAPQIMFLGLSGVQQPKREDFKASRCWLGAKFSLLQYLNVTPNNRFSMGLRLEGVYANVPDMNSTFAKQLIMPAFKPTAHSYISFMPELSAERYLAAGLIPTIRVWRDLSLRGEIYGMLRDKFDDGQSPRDGASVEYVSQLSVAYATTLGPLSLSLTKYNLHNSENLYLIFNFGINIFSPRGTFY